MHERHGWLVLDKPLGMTSRGVVNLAQKWFPRKTPLGHTGTLDPLATGVLVLAVGQTTRLAEYVQDMGKVYSSEFTLGATSRTDDAEGPITPQHDAVPPPQELVESTLNSFVGVIQQTPPAFSAVHVEGKRAYKQARQGNDVEIAARPVRVDAIRVLAYTYPRLSLEITCGKGTYIRSLARDLGQRLGCGGYVSELRRTAVGGFTCAEAVTLDGPPRELLPVERGVERLPRVELSAELVQRLRQGQTVPGLIGLTGELAAFDADDRLVAIVRATDGWLRPHKVFAG